MLVERQCKKHSHYLTGFKKRAKQNCYQLKVRLAKSSSKTTANIKERKESQEWNPVATFVQVETMFAG